jgi:WD40 repeat protein
MVKEFQNHGCVNSVCVGKIGGKDYLFTGCSDKKARMYDVNSGEMLKEWKHDDVVWSLCVGKIGGKDYLFTRSEYSVARMYPI